MEASVAHPLRPANRWREKTAKAKRTTAIAATLTGLGVLIEILQGEFFSRQFQVTDMAANVTGIAIGLVVTAVMARRGRAC